MQKFPKQLVSTQQLSFSQIEKFLQKSTEMEKNLVQNQTLTKMNGKIMAALFYEPSTRTRLSFETAFLKLGGQIISATDLASSSLKKGETIHDTFKVIENYADVIVMRHPEEGSAKKAIQATEKPFVNAGDGIGEHPSQALIDLYTIQKNHHNIDQLEIGFVGDLKYGRTVHSLVYLLSNFDVNFVFISPKELQIPIEIKNFLQEKKMNFQEIDQIDPVIQKLDVMYVTRVQEERFEDLEEYARLKNRFIVDSQIVKKGKPNLTIMHPLPRINEIKTDVDALPNARYFEQVKNSIPVRMAILDLVMQV